MTLEQKSRIAIRASKRTFKMRQSAIIITIETCTYGKLLNEWQKTIFELCKYALTSYRWYGNAHAKRPTTFRFLVCPHSVQTILRCKMECASACAYNHRSSLLAMVTGCDSKRSELTNTPVTSMFDFVKQRQWPMKICISYRFKSPGFTDSYPIVQIVCRNVTDRTAILTVNNITLGPSRYI